MAPFHLALRIWALLFVVACRYMLSHLRNAKVKTNILPSWQASLHQGSCEIGVHPSMICSMHHKAHSFKVSRGKWNGIPHVSWHRQTGRTLIPYTYIYQYCWVRRERRLTRTTTTARRRSLPRSWQTSSRPSRSPSLSPPAPPVSAMHMRVCM
jgi:hypothetical protein